MNDKLRILMSSRDPGSAAHMIELIRLFKNDERFDTVVVASGVAHKVLSEVHAEVQRFVFADGVDHVKQGDEASDLLLAANELVARVNPDAIFTGLSSMGFGVDEALLAQAQGLPTFTYQDFWGDVNDNLGVRSDLYFVLDEYAVEVTKERWNANSIAVGSPKHSAYASLDVDEMRIHTRKRLGIVNGRKTLGFFAQTSQLPGHENAFIDLANVVAEMEDKPLFLLREHAKFLDDRISHLDCLKGLGIEVVDVTDEPNVEPLLAACDVVCTCYSSCALDHAYLSAHSQQPIGVSVYVLTNPEIRAAHMDICGFPVFPSVSQGIGFVARDINQLGRSIETAFQSDSRQNYHSASKTLSTSYLPELIIDTVAQAAVHSRQARSSDLEASVRTFSRWD